VHPMKLLQRKGGGLGVSQSGGLLKFRREHAAVKVFLGGGRTSAKRVYKIDSIKRRELK